MNLLSKNGCYHVLSCIKNAKLRLVDVKTDLVDDLLDALITFEEKVDSLEMPEQHRHWIVASHLVGCLKSPSIFDGFFVWFCAAPVSITVCFFT